MRFINLLILLICSVGYSQKLTLTGQVVDQDEQPVEHAQASLWKNDTLLIAQQLTDNLGSFSFYIDQGEYVIRINQFDEDFFSKKIELSQNIDLGIIKVDNSISLDDIEISVLRKIVKESVDKTTIEVKDQQIFAGDNVVSILDKIQGIVVINDRILYDGVEVNSVKVNNRNLNFNSQKEMMDYLKNLDDKAIKSIDIFNPSAKYSASNSGKTLNINIDQPVLDGFSFNPKVDYSQGIYADKNLSLFSQLKKGKVSSNLFLSYGENKNYSDQNTIINYKYINETQVQNNEFISTVKPFNLNIDVQYDINSSTYIGAALMYNSMNLKDNTQSIIDLYKDDLHDSIFSNQNYLDVRGEYYTGSLYFNKQLDTLGQNIRLELNYNIYNTTNDQFLTNEINSDIQTVFNQKVNRKVYLPNVSIDYDKKILGDANLSVGLLYYNMDNDEDRNILNEQFSDFQYSENVFAHYISLLGKTKYFSYQIGLRGEATSNTFSNYYDLFPSLSLRKSFNDLNVQLSYNKSIIRPTGYMLSPNLIYQNQYLARVGNPELNPTIRDLISSVFSYRAWRLSLSYYNYKNSINVFQKISDSNSRLIIDQYINLYEKYQADFSLSYSYRKKDIMIMPMFSYSLGSFRLNKQSEKKENDFSYFGLTTSYNISKTDRIDAKFRYFIESRQLYSVTKDRHSFDITYNKSLLDNKLNIQVFVKDIFKGDVDNIRNTLQSFESISEKYNDSRQVGLSIRYSFTSGEKVKVDGAQNNVNRK